MKLRLKILGGFLTLAFMLLIATGWSVFEVQFFGSTLNDMYENNYKSITASKLMKEALEREDSALLLILLDNDNRGIKILSAADSIFSDNFELAKSNITIEGERQLIDLIAEKYEKYKSQWDIPIHHETNQNKLNWYFENIHQSFLDLMIAVDDLTGLNDNELYSTAVQVNDRSRRAIMPGIVALAAMIVFALLFNYFINLYIVSPILEIIRRLNLFMKRGTMFDYHVDTKDEMSQLTETLNTFCTHVEASRTVK